MFSSRLAIAVALPLVLWLGALGLAEQAWRNVETWRFAIAGYDPRDPLRGQFVRFRIDISTPESDAECDPEERGDCCLCLRREAGQDLVTSAASVPCDVAPGRCAAIARIDEVVGEHRFFVPEARAAELDERIRDAARRRVASVEASVDAGGHLQIRRLLADGEPLW